MEAGECTAREKPRTETCLTQVDKGPGLAHQPVHEAGVEITVINYTMSESQTAVCTVRYSLYKVSDFEPRNP